MSPTSDLDLPPGLAERLERMGTEFLAELYGRSIARHPDQLELLSELATLLTRLGRYEEGLALDQRLVTLAPRDATVRYNLACSLALTGQAEAALEHLEIAAELGYADGAHLQTDEDLSSLRSHPRFQALVARLTG